MKKVVALLTAVCLSITPVTVFAEETDYSYLEDMSVKELRELRDAINEILGEDSASTNDIYSKHPEWEEYDMSIPPYSDAILLTQTLKDSVSNPSLFKLKQIQYVNKNSKDYYFFQFYVPTKLGGQDFQMFIIEMKDGDEVELYDDITSSEFTHYQFDYFGKSHSDEWDYLDVKFIESQLD